jgi:hypothetical protein
MAGVYAVDATPGEVQGDSLVEITGEILDEKQDKK